MNFARRLLLSSSFICLIENHASNALDANQSDKQQNGTQQAREDVKNKRNANQVSSHESRVNTQKNSDLPNLASGPGHDFSRSRQSNTHHRVTNRTNFQGAPSSMSQPLNSNQSSTAYTENQGNRAHQHKIQIV